MTNVRRPSPKINGKSEVANGLVGRHFHIFDEQRQVQFQGKVIAYLGDGGYYLIQFFEWMVGEESTLEVQHIREMTPPRWQFYEDVEHMRFWYQYRYSPEDRSAKLHTDGE